MKAQVYPDGLCRVFQENEMLFEFTAVTPIKSEVDRRLRQIRMKRRESWKDYPHMSEARIRFITTTR